MLLLIMIIAGVVFLDQLSKWLTVINLEYIAPPEDPATIPVIKDVFHFTYVRNPGAAFSMFSAPDQRWIFMSISSIAIVALAAYLWFNRKGSKLLCIGLSFIIGGGIGNMIDRCALKYVIDMFDFRLIQFAIFNVADSFVCVGVGMFALAVILEELQTAKKSKSENVAKAKALALACEEETADERVEENAEDNTESDS